MFKFEKGQAWQWACDKYDTYIEEGTQHSYTRLKGIKRLLNRIKKHKYYLYLKTVWLVQISLIRNNTEKRSGRRYYNKARVILLTLWHAR